MIPLRVPVFEPVLGEEELQNVTEAIRSGWISSLGAFIGEFERTFAEYCGARYGIAVANGTAALHLGLAATGVGPGDEVIVPSLTFVATANAVRYCGATPVFAECDRVTWNLDPAAVAARVTERTRAIVPVHLYGHPCDMDPIAEIARRHRLAIVEDAAEAHGAEYHGRRTGTLGTVGCFSFYGNKIITTGEGGMCVTDDALLAERLRMLRDHGMDPKRHYWHPIVGFNYRMTNLQAAVGVAQVKRLPGFVEAKRRIAGWYRERLAPLARRGLVTLPPEAPWAKNVFWMFSVLIDEPSVSRDEVRTRLREAGIDSRPFFEPIHTMPPYASGERLPIAEDLAARGLNLPSGVGLTGQDVGLVVDALADALEQRPT